jgi:FAD/FMN-containing dehydrogenase/Fe-S oxidoreductase
LAGIFYFYSLYGNITTMNQKISLLIAGFEGDLFGDLFTRTLYATDASIYREIPAGVAYPRNSEDIIRLIRFAHENKISLIPRTAGTSLAGQVVGPGIVVDVSRYMNKILEVNTAERYAWVEPGVVLEELNRNLLKHKLFFGPETSTANRCMIGGMLGNNACGLHSVVYGSTRDHTLSVRGVLSDGSEVEFSDLDPEGFTAKCAQPTLEGKIYREIRDILKDPVNRREILNGYPDPSVPRRNSGYALDLLMDMVPFNETGNPFNMCRILGGSEGTLVFFTAIRINLVDVPPPHKALVCPHFDSLPDTMKANLVALSHFPTAVELMDDIVLENALCNHTQQANSFFLVGSPKTVLMIEFAENTPDQLEAKVEETIQELKDQNLGYAYPVVYGTDIARVWDLRKAGLGSLSNIPGDNQAVTMIEDTAVPVARLADYVAEMGSLFERHGLQCVYYAHVGTGELHLRPVLNLKDPADVERFGLIMAETAAIVKKYGGSMSGEHGDGRLRAGLLPFFLGEHNYNLICRVKEVFDPLGILNPGKITQPAPNDTFLRNEPGCPTPDIPTCFEFPETLGIVRAAEKCNGSGDCRKSHLAKGGMCPSYQATLDEKNTTRARANILREFLVNPTGKNIFDHQEIYDVLDLCLSCKACKSECPSNVDMTKLKAEFLQHWHEARGIPARTRLIAYLPSLYRLAQPFAAMANLAMQNGPVSGLFKKLAGFHPDRSLPRLSTTTLSRWNRRNHLSVNSSSQQDNGYIWLFADEFTNYQDASTGIRAIRLLTALGYGVKIAGRGISGRTYLSRGLVRKAAVIARRNVIQYHCLASAEHPLLGIEPSAIMGFRDEFPNLVGPELRQKAIDLNEHTMTVEEFLFRELKAGKITSERFTKEHRQILLHGHCHQKALGSTGPTLALLNLPENYTCREIPSGCCGMAGSFGFEREHFNLSMKVGELVLFPAVRSAAEEVTICAPGTSCRHQISDGTGREALHPVDVLYEALIQAV